MSQGESMPGVRKWILLFQPIEKVSMLSCQQSLTRINHAKGRAEMSGLHGRLDLLSGHFGDFCSGDGLSGDLYALKAAGTVEDLDAATKVRDAFEKMWAVIVWNDPVNLMSYVVFVFKRVLKMNSELAHKHMMEVHEKGKSLVARETREKAEFFVHQLQGFGLQATMERSE